MIFVLRFIRERMFQDDSYGFKNSFEEAMQNIEIPLKAFGKKPEQLNFIARLTALESVKALLLSTLSSLMIRLV